MKIKAPPGVIVVVVVVVVDAVDGGCADGRGNYAGETVNR